MEFLILALVDELALKISSPSSHATSRKNVLKRISADGELRYRAPPRSVTLFAEKVTLRISRPP
jgi:hypothetical protein